MQKTLSKFLMEALSLQRYASVLGDVKNLVSNEPDMYQWNPKYLEKEFRESPLEKDRQAYRLFIPLGSPVKYRIIKLFDKYGLKLISYKTGKVVSPVPGATYPLNIGAVLNDLINNKGLMKKYDIVLRNPEDKKEAIELLRLFAKDNDNRQKDDGTTTIGPDDEPKWIVISRHPYDIAGMSTGREWTSCQNLVSGGLCEYVPQDIAAGSIVAYLIKDSDRTETVNKGDVLRNPLSRTMIVPYINNRGETAYGISNKQYTKDNRNPIFPIIVKQWVDELNKKKGIRGIYRLHSGVYGEVESRIIADDEYDAIMKLSSSREYFVKNRDIVINRIKNLDNIEDIKELKALYMNDLFKNIHFFFERTDDAQWFVKTFYDEIQNDSHLDIIGIIIKSLMFNYNYHEIRLDVLGIYSTAYPFKFINNYAFRMNRNALEANSEKFTLLFYSLDESTQKRLFESNIEYFYSIATMHGMDDQYLNTFSYFTHILFSKDMDEILKHVEMLTFTNLTERGLPIRVLDQFFDILLSKSSAMRSSIGVMLILQEIYHASFNRYKRTPSNETKEFVNYVRSRMNSKIINSKVVSTFLNYVENTEQEIGIQTA
jgi:hypothetical protein